MTVLKNLQQRITEIEEKVDDCRHVNWSVDWELPVLLIAIAVMAYGCSRSSEIDERKAIYSKCAAQTELSKACELILGQRH